jgi:ribonucleoside-diphosphate reductase alpha chain
MQAPTSTIQTYTYEEVYKQCMLYFKDDELAASTWINKYALKNKSGEFVELTPDDMHKRMAKEFARKEQDYQRTSQTKNVSIHLSDYGKKRELLSEEKIVN